MAAWSDWGDCRWGCSRVGEPSASPRVRGMVEFTMHLHFSGLLSGLIAKSLGDRQPDIDALGDAQDIGGAAIWSFHQVVFSCLTTAGRTLNNDRRYEVVVGCDRLDGWTVTVRFGRIGQSCREMRFASSKLDEMMAYEKLRHELRRYR